MPDATMPTPQETPLRILHAVRAPVGGIIRHILDLAAGQAERGHQVGIVADSLTGGDRAAAALEAIAPKMSLGVYRMAMRRAPHPADLFALPKFAHLVRGLDPDILHGHGAKAGALVRLAPVGKGPLRVYTPHGGVLHYSPSTAKGAVFAALERILIGRTDLFLFESLFARDTYQRFIGTPTSTVRCVFNGVGAAEFDPIVPDTDATDIVYVGEFRYIKGADLLVEAVAKLRAAGRPVTLTLCGDGEEQANIKALVAERNLAQAVRFAGHVKARDGFAKGRLLVVPSRGDSMPYVAIEAGAAGVPMIGARVGGIPEILGDGNPSLFAPNDAQALANAIVAALDAPDEVKARARELRERIFMHFSQKAMVEGVLAAYREALSAKPALHSARADHN
jgi:glycosyltransferase involved in cell wall biosynthesis